MVSSTIRCHGSPLRPKHKKTHETKQRCEPMLIPVVAEAIRLSSKICDGGTPTHWWPHVPCGKGPATKSLRAARQIVEIRTTRLLRCVAFFIRTRDKVVFLLAPAVNITPTSRVASQTCTWIPLSASSLATRNANFLSLETTADSVLSLNYPSDGKGTSQLTKRFCKKT